jgi:hypothetical protein
MRDTHANYYHAVAANVVVDRPIAHQLSVEWEYQDRISESIVARLVQASRLPGFSGSLSFGTRIGYDHASNVGVPAPSWMSLLHLHGKENVPVVPSFEESGDIPRELDVDTELVVQFVERISISEPML